MLFYDVIDRDMFVFHFIARNIAFLTILPEREICFTDTKPINFDESYVKKTRQMK